ACSRAGREPTATPYGQQRTGARDHSGRGEHDHRQHRATGGGQRPTSITWYLGDLTHLVLYRVVGHRVVGHRVVRHRVVPVPGLLILTGQRRVLLGDGDTGDRWGGRGVVQPAEHLDGVPGLGAPEVHRLPVDTDRHCRTADRGGDLAGKLDRLVHTGHSDLHGLHGGDEQLWLVGGQQLVVLGPADGH